MSGAGATIVLMYVLSYAVMPSGHSLNFLRLDDLLKEIWNGTERTGKRGVPRYLAR